MNIAEFDYHLPPELIAQEPLADRAASRMLVIDRARGVWEDRLFRDLPSFLRSGDCLVMNNTRVFPSRLLGHRQGHTGKVEVFLTRPLSADRRRWDCLVRPGRKVLSGTVIEFGDQLRGVIQSHGDHGHRTIELEWCGDLDEVLDRIGHTPLPPYIHRPDDPADRERYQTVFAKERGSVAAPTAGLHFTPEVLQSCRNAGARTAEVTLHVGLGTFEPLHTDIVEEAKLHSEFYAVTTEAAQAVNEADRVLAVGTTSVRTLETVGRADGFLHAGAGDTDIYIYPGFEFRVVDAMLTNFHLPQSSLMLLVSAFAGKDLILAAYRHAVEQRYRFFSYGDCMLIL